MKKWPRVERLNSPFNDRGICLRIRYLFISHKYYPTYKLGKQDVLSGWGALFHSLRPFILFDVQVINCIAAEVPLNFSYCEG